MVIIILPPYSIMLYEVTVTLRPMMYRLTAVEQFYQTMGFLTSIHDGYDKVSCIAELTQEHNIHYHILIDLGDSRRDKDKYLNRYRAYHKYFGRKSCAQVRYEDSYKKYMVKDIEETKKIIKDPIVRDYFGLYGIRFGLNEEDIVELINGYSGEAPTPEGV